MKVGLIDIGSNTCKLLIAVLDSLKNNQCFSVIDQYSRPCRLIDASTTHDGRIDNQKIHSLVSCLQNFKETCERYSVNLIKTVATEALRSAKNSEDIIRIIEEKTGFRVEILTGIDEAMAIAQGLQTDPALKNWNDYIGLDIGGGSIEVIEVVSKKVNQVKSLPLGAVRVALSSNQDFSEKISPLALDNAKGYVQNIINHELVTFSNQSGNLAATGGTLVFLREILEVKKNLSSEGYLDRMGIEEIFKEYCDLPLEKRINLYPSLPSDRADIFPYGLLSILEIMNFLKIDRFIHSYRNLRYGLIQSILNPEN